MTHTAATTQRRALARGRAWPWATVFAAALFFFGAADLVFATRLLSLNFRWAQLLLLGGAVACLPFAWQGLRDRRAEVFRAIPLVIAWSVFLAAYGLSALTSEAPGRSLVKLAWGGFNILGALTVCLLNPKPRQMLLDAFVAGCTLVAAVIWVDSLALFWVGLEAPLIGLAQLSYQFEGQRMLRPHAFYYEPSYAGAWLAFGLPVVVLGTWQRPRWLGLLLPALVLGAAVLTSSRTGILSAMACLCVAGLLGLARRDWMLIRKLATISLITALLLTAFFTPPRAAQYGRFISGPLGPSALLERLRAQPPEEAVEGPDEALDGATRPSLLARLKAMLDGRLAKTSEGNRLSSYVTAIERWWQRPLLGHGVALHPQEGRLLGPVTINTWLELLAESGLLGLLTFLGALIVSMRAALKHAGGTQLTLLAAAWACHFLINLNLTQTYPRLDYWLLFFLTVRLALPDAQTQEPIAQRLG